MFGAFFLVYILCYSTYTFVHNLKQNIRNRERTYDEVSNTYVCYNGNLVDMDTGRARFVYCDSNYDKWLCGKDIQDVNLSQRQREIEYEKLKDNPKQRTAIYYEPEPPNIIYGDGTKRGRRYKDLHTGDLYIVRLDENGHAFYVRVDDDKVVRFTDKHISNLLEWNLYKKEEEIKAVKEFQDKIDKAKTESFWKRHDPTLIGDSKIDYEG